MTRFFAKTALCISLLCASSAYGAPKERFVIGVVPEINLVKQMERYVPLSDYLDKKTGFDIEIKPLSNYGQLYEDMQSGRVDGGFFGSLIYCIAHSKMDIIPIARPVQTTGKSTYKGVIFIRKDAGIRKPSDMKGKTIALVDPATTGGYLAQKDYFANHGINIDRDLNIIWAGSHEAAIQAVLSHQADLGGAKSTIVSKYRKGNKVFDTFLDIIDESPKTGVPDNTLALRKGIAPDKAELLKKTLVEMNNDPEGKIVLKKFGVLKFIPTSDADFRPLYDLVHHLRIDLKSYPYKKELRNHMNEGDKKDVR